MQGFLGFRWSRDCGNDPGGEVAPSRQVKEPQSLLRGRCDHALVTQSTGTRATGGGAFPGFRVSFGSAWWECGVSLLVIMRGNLAFTGLGLSCYTTSRCWRSGRVRRFDLRGWSTSEVGIQVRTCDGLLAALLRRWKGGHGRRWPVCCSDGEGEFGGRCRELTTRLYVGGDVVVPAAQVLDERMPCTDHSR